MVFQTAECFDLFVSSKCHHFPCFTLITYWTYVNHIVNKRLNAVWVSARRALARKGKFRVSNSPKLLYAHFAPQASQALVAWLLGTSPRISHWRNLDSVIFQHFYEGSWVRVLKKQYYPFCDSPGPSVYNWTRRSRMATSYCFAIWLNLPVQTLLCPKLPSGSVRSYHLAEVLVRKSTRNVVKRRLSPKAWSCSSLLCSPGPYCSRVFWAFESNSIGIVSH